MTILELRNNLESYLKKKNNSDITLKPAFIIVKEDILRTNAPLRRQIRETRIP